MDPNSPPGAPQEPPLATAVAYQPPPRPPRARTRPALRWLLVLLVLGLCGSLLLNVILFGLAGLSGIASLDTDREVREKLYSHQRRSNNKVAILSLEGAIFTGEGFIKRQIDRAMDDTDVKAVVLRVNSPGGTITGTDYVYHHLRRLAEQREIPIVVSMGSLAASGGYYVSMACGDTPGTIFAEPTTWTGSIGVIIPHYDLSGLLEHWKIENDSIVSHPYKQMLSYTKPMTEEERKVVQKLVDEGFNRFKEVIKQGRPAFKKDPKGLQALEKLATGQIYTAGQALDNGLIDEIGFLEDAVDKAIELARLDEDDVTVVEYKREPNLADLLLGARAESRPLDPAKILEMTVPRAYYLCTWLPPLAGSAKP